MRIIIILSLCYAPIMVWAQGESFSPKRIVNANTVAGRLRHPFAMVMGPDDSLWITERRGYVVRMNRFNGGKTELLNIRNQVRFTTSFGGIKQDGMFGIALHPELHTPGKNFVYTAYTYDSSGHRRVRIVRFTYNRSVPSLSNEVILVNGIHGSDDHNGGRLIIINAGTETSPDYKLLYSCGDRGANQFANACDSLESQYIPTSAQIAAGNKRRYNGKILRINLDGSIPSDNPDFGGIGRSHVWSIGHRNPQGIAVQKGAGNVIVPNGIIYSSEQGPATNDEVNIITGGRNYGWPRIAGKKDNNWYRYYQWSNNGGCSSYPGECSNNQTSSGLTENSFNSPIYTDPVFDLYPGTPPGGAGCNWLTNPTLAPSSIAHYPFRNRIPGWHNSLLISTLKSSAVYRLRMSEDGIKPIGVDSVIQYFKEPSLNRYRDIVIANDGITFYLLTDSVGATSGPSSGMDGGITNRGAVIEYIYTGTVLSIPGTQDSTEEAITRIYPNPASSVLNVELQGISSPVKCELVSMTGQIVYTRKFRRDVFQLPVESLPAGLYMLRIYNNRDILRNQQKVVLQ